jgi:hypothetical protein
MRIINAISLSFFSLNLSSTTASKYQMSSPLKAAAATTTKITIASEDDKEQICIIGSGNWGSAIATVVGRNALRLPFYQNEVRMWVFEEEIRLHKQNKTAKLSDVINERHENVKYLPGIKIPSNVRAVPDLVDAVRNATVLIFVLPHQFLPKLLPIIRSNVNPSRCYGISLIKGLDFDANTKLPLLISKSIEKVMGNQFRCGVLMGANVADEVAKQRTCESTLACDFGSDTVNERIRQLFDEEHFRVSRIADVAGAEACGALKNIIALGEIETCCSDFDAFDTFFFSSDYCAHVSHLVNSRSRLRRWIESGRKYQSCVVTRWSERNVKILLVSALA